MKVIRHNFLTFINVPLTETDLYLNSKVYVTDGKGPSLGVAYIFGYMWYT